MGKCKYCNSTGHGACVNSPHKFHELPEDEKRCVFCGSSGYGNCSYGPARKHKHGSGANKCRWCGSTSSGRGCPYNPDHVHEK
jgi:hypothetical protein